MHLKTYDFPQTFNISVVAHNEIRRLIRQRCSYLNHKSVHTFRGQTRFPYFLSSELSSGDRELRLFSSRLLPSVLPRRHVAESHRHREPPARLAKVMPAALLASQFHQEPGGQRSVNLLAQPQHEVQPENAVMSARHLVTMVSNLSSDWLHDKT